MSRPLDKLLARLADHDPYCRVVEQAHDGRREVIVVHAPGDLVPPVTIVMPAVDMKAQLAGFVTLRNQETRMRKVPEASRRRDERRRTGHRSFRREGDHND